jgi:hypothetical protein
MAAERAPWLGRWEWSLLALLFLLGAGIRLQLVTADYFSDEPMSYALSRHGFTPPANVRDVDGVGTWHYPRSWFLERPGFYVGMMPAAWISFTAYRVEYILVAALLAPLGAALLRAAQVRPVFAYPVGLVVATHPLFVLWGTITHMDTPMTVCLAGGFLANLRARHRLAGGLFTLAVWTKETAMPFLVIVLLGQLALDAWRTRRVPWPLRLDGERSALAAGIVCGFIPFIVAQEMWFGLPGEHAVARTKDILDGAFLVLWILPLIVLGLVWTRTRMIAVWALALPAFYLVLHWLFDWNVREWYLIGSSFFSLVAVGATLDEAWTRARRLRPTFGAAPAAVGVAVMVLMAAMIVQPDGNDKRRVANPLTRWVAPSLEQTLAQQHVRDLPGRALLAALREAHPRHVLLIDVHYAFSMHPIPTFTDQVRVIHTFELHGDYNLTRTVVQAAESFANLTVMQKLESPQNQAFRRVYADCVVKDDPHFVFMDIRACPGRLDALYGQLAFTEAPSA